MALFVKEACGICGKGTNLGKRKLDDGVICVDCEELLSPFFGEHHRPSLQGIRDQLAYREANKNEVAAFNVTRELGADTKILIDEGTGKFIVSSSGEWRDENPDVISLSQVKGCDIEVRESRTEVKRTAAGSDEGFDHSHWDVDYRIYVTIHVDSPWFDDIEFKTHSGKIDQKGSAEYESAERVALDIREELSGKQLGAAETEL